MAEAAVQLSLDQELTAIQHMNALMDRTIAENDHTARTMLPSYVEEQMEEVANFWTLLQNGRARG